jgi:proteasome lid subunit RPN8/RPN11
MSSGRLNIPSPAQDEWRERAAAVVDPEREPAQLGRSLLAEVFAHARECYPEECCGLLFGPPEGDPRQVVRCANVQSLRHAKGESRLDASQGFWIDAQELERALRAAEQHGETLRVVYHSHVDAEAYLSHTDLEAAIGPGGTPLWHGVAHLVVSVRDATVRGAVLFEWDPEQAVFVGRSVREAR